jgi:hypothetical protein
VLRDFLAGWTVAAEHLSEAATLFLYVMAVTAAGSSRGGKSTRVRRIATMAVGSPVFPKSTPTTHGSAQPAVGQPEHDCSEAGRGRTPSDLTVAEPPRRNGGRRRDQLPDRPRL